MKKRWEVLKEEKFSDNESITKALLDNRGITDANRFFNPLAPQEILTGAESFFPDLETDQLNKAVKRIRSAIEDKEKIVVWGDYDVDGVCATAVLWQTLYGLGAQVLPHIPNRFEEGYGLNESMIRKLGEEGNRLIITVDSGITAVTEAEAAREIGIDLIITDHHLKPKQLPEAHAIVHTTALCGTGIAWLVASKLASKPSSLDSSLDLVAIATVADLQPLLDTNRSLVKEGFKVLNKLDRPGLAALVEVAGLKPGNLGSYAAGWVLGPRINAVGRVRQGIEALRLLCTPNLNQARSLAHILNLANAERQALTLHTFDHAKGLVEDDDDLIVIFHDSWHEGIIGLVAGRVVEEYGRPAVVISKGKEFSKGSARSVNGLNIVEILRAESDLLEDVGGHTAAAGFTIRTDRLEEFVSRIKGKTRSMISRLDPRPVLKIDLSLPVDRLNFELVSELSNFAPHGVGNPEPVFVDWGARITGKSKMGREGRHLKLTLSPESARADYEAVWFRANPPEELDRGSTVSLVYTPQIEEWNGKESVRLRVRDLKIAS